MATTSSYRTTRMQQPTTTLSLASDKLRYTSTLKAHLEDYEDVVVAFWNDVLLFRSPGAAAAVYGGVGAVLWVIVHSNLPLVSVLALGFASYTVVTEAVLPLDTKEWLTDEYESPNIYHRRSHRHSHLQLNRRIAPSQSLDTIIDILADMSVTVMRGWISVKAWKERYPGLYIPATCCLAMQISVLGTKVPGYIFAGMLVYSALLVPAMRFYGLLRWLEQFYHFAAVWTEKHAREVYSTNYIISKPTPCVLPSTFPSSPQLTSSVYPLIVAADGSDNTELQMTDLLDLTTEQDLAIVLDDEQENTPESESRSELQDESEVTILREEGVDQERRTNLSDSEPKPDNSKEANAFDVDERVVTEDVTEAREGSAAKITIESEIESHDQLVSSPPAESFVERTADEIVTAVEVENEIEIAAMMAMVDVDICHEERNESVVENTVQDEYKYGELQRDEVHVQVDEQEADEQEVDEQEVDEQEVDEQEADEQEDDEQEDDEHEADEQEDDEQEADEQEADDDYDSDWEKDFNVPSPSASTPISSSSASTANLTNDIISLTTPVRSASIGFVRSVGRKLGVGNGVKKVQHGNEYVDDTIDDFGEEDVEGSDALIAALAIAIDSDERRAA